MHFYVILFSNNESSIYVLVNVNILSNHVNLCMITPLSFFFLILSILVGRIRTIKLPILKMFF